MMRLRFSHLPTLALVLALAGSTVSSAQPPPSAPTPMTPQPWKDLGGSGVEPGKLAKVGRDLALLYQEHEAHRKGRSLRPFQPSNPLVRLHDDRVVIDLFYLANFQTIVSQPIKVMLQEMTNVIDG